MKPSDDQRAIHSGGSSAKASFGISTKDTAHIMGILREGIYSDKILAVLREYSSNAWDAHRDAGLHHMPIMVHIPTSDELLFTVRDFGKGLSHEDVFEIYTQYGSSTRRGSNDAVGMLGIGSKSGFAYSDSFTVISYHGGKKRIYIAVLDPSDKGELQFVHEEDSDETGIEIQITVRQEDQGQFAKKAASLFQHYKPRPTINIYLPDPPDAETVLENGSMYAANGDHQWIAVMGCVPYRVNTAQLPTEQIGKFLPKISGSLFFDIGEVQISASREELKYSDKTKLALVEKFNALVDEFVQHTLDTLGSDTISPWEKRLRAQVLNTLELPVPKEWDDITDAHAKLVYDGSAFTLIHNRSACTRVSVGKDVRLIIDDTGNDLIGYRLNHTDYVVRPLVGKTLDEAVESLNVALKASGMDGITIIELSTQPYTPPYKKPKKVNNPKHKVSTFKLIPKHAYGNPYSEHWSSESRVPTKDDIFVITKNFRVDSSRDFFKNYIDDRAICEAFGYTMPEIYGYKTTLKKPVDPLSLEGTSYFDWRRTFVQNVISAKPELLGLIAELHWSTLASDGYASTPSRSKLDNLQKELGAKHPIIALYRRHEAGKVAIDRIIKHKDALANLATRSMNPAKTSEAKLVQDKLALAYPLLFMRTVGASSLWSGYNDSEWLAYVQLVDDVANYKHLLAAAVAKKPKDKNHAPAVHDHP